MTERWRVRVPRKVKKPATVTHLQLVPVWVNQNIIDMLEGVLARVRTGEVRGAAIATSLRGAATGSAYVVGDGDVAHLVTGLERAKLRLLTHGGPLQGAV